MNREWLVGRLRDAVESDSVAEVVELFHESVSVAVGVVASGEVVTAEVLVSRCRW